MIKVLFVAAEAAPFVKSGGLGDVVGTLPKELRKQGVDVRVMLPQYQDISVRFTEKMRVQAELTVPVGWRQQYCGINYLDYQGMPFYFIDNKQYFARPGLYGHDDEGERFAFFCRAVLEVLPQLDFFPDILHCHDWHTGMVSVLLNAHYSHMPQYQKLRTLFTIHNLRYQGVFPKEILPDLLALDWNYFTMDGVEFYDKVNFMKGGLAFSNIVSTVSQTYAKEIQQPFFGEKLDGLLRKRQSDLEGIINGIDYDVYNPAEDKDIIMNYNVKTLEGKQKNKLELQKRLGLPVKDVMLIAIVSRLVDAKGMDLLGRVLGEILSVDDVQLVILGTGEERYQHWFQLAAWLHPDKISANIFFDDKLAHWIYAGADLLLMPSLYEPCGISQMIAMRYGTIPLVRETGGLKDTIQPYNQYTGEGNGFSFTNYNAHDMMYTLRLALAIYRENRVVWTKIMENAMKSNYSWQQSARQYQLLYNKLYLETGGNK